MGVRPTNTLRIPVDVPNEAVLQAIEQHALTPEAVESVIALTERDDRRDQEAALVRERADVDKRIANLVAAIEAGGDAPSLVTKVRALEARRGAIADELAGLRPVPRVPAAIVRDRLAEWRRLLRASVTQGRAVIQRIVVGRIRFTPRTANAFEVDGGYDFEAQTRFVNQPRTLGLPREPSGGPRAHRECSRSLLLELSSRANTDYPLTLSKPGSATRDRSRDCR